MDLHIRNIDPYAVKKIDEWAKKKGVSRQVYLKETIESFAMLELISNSNRYYDKQIQANTIFLQKASDEFEALVRILKELL